VIVKPNGTNGARSASVQEEFDALQKTLSARQQDLKRVRIFRIIRFALISALVVMIVGFLWSYFSQVKSYSGFINGQLYALRSPIEGTIRLGDFAIGTPVHPGQMIGKVENSRTYDLSLKQMDLTSQLESSREQLASLESQIAERSAMLAQYSGQSSIQKNVRLTYESQHLTALQHSIEAAEAGYKQAQADAVRYQILADKGYAPRATAESYVTQAKEAEASLSQKQAELQEGRAKLQAAKAGLQVDGSLTASYPEMRHDQLQTELFQLRMQENQLRLDTRLLEDKLNQVNAQYRLAQLANLISPAEGIIWKIEAPSGEDVQANQPLVSVLDCNHLWVDTYVDDRQLQHINTQAPVHLKLAGLGQQQTIEGMIEAIRPGTGRYTVGQNALNPPEAGANGQTMIRIKLPSLMKFPGMQSCAVGSAVEASFKRR